MLEEETQEQIMKLILVLTACAALQGCAAYAEALMESRRPETQLRFAVERLEWNQLQLERQLRRK